MTFSLSKEKQHTMGALILRYSIALVFLWFGFMQLHTPTQWVSFLPDWSTKLPISQVHFVLLNGLFEIIGATLLLLGAYTQLTAALLGLHLFGIAATIGINNIGIRDFGLACATLALSFFGAGTFSIDTLTKREIL